MAILVRTHDQLRSNDWLPGGCGGQGLTADPMVDSIANADHCVALTDPIRERSSDTNATISRSGELPERYCGEWMCAKAFNASFWDACGRLGAAWPS